MFVKFYEHLSGNYVFDTPDILDFYIDTDILESCIGVDVLFEKYTQSVKQMLDAMPRVVGTKQAASTVTRTINLFREDKIE